MENIIYQSPDAASTPTELDEFGSRLGQLIATLNISQNEFARRLGASPAFLSHLVRGAKLPGAEFLHRIAKCYGVSIDWLLLGQGTMFGLAAINPEELASVQQRLALAEMAIIDKDPDALRLVEQLKGAEGIQTENVSAKLLQTLVDAQKQAHATGALYNQHLWITDQDERLRQIMKSAMQQFSPTNRDPLAALSGNSVLNANTTQQDHATGVTQNNIGIAVKATGIRIGRK